MKDDTDVSFYIVGGGVNETQLKAFAKEKELNNVTFVGMQPPEEVADLYAAADVNVIPLQKGLIYAALPSKTADCLIAGKPIITCVDEESNFASMIKKDGYENVDPDDVQKLKSILLKTKESETKTKSSKHCYDRFAMKRNVTKYCEGIEQA